MNLKNSITCEESCRKSAKLQRAAHLVPRGGRPTFGFSDATNRLAMQIDRPLHSSPRRKYLRAEAPSYFTIVNTPLAQTCLRPGHRLMFLGRPQAGSWFPARLIPRFRPERVRLLTRQLQSFVYTGWRTQKAAGRHVARVNLDVKHIPNTSISIGV